MGSGPRTEEPRSWERLLEGPESPCEANSKTCCCVWDGAGQAEEGGKALSPLSPPSSGVEGENRGHRRALPQRGLDPGSREGW